MQNTKYALFVIVLYLPVADPGFPIVGGGVLSRWGGATSDVGTFRQKCMQKWKNWILLGVGGRSPAAPPGSANVYIQDVRAMDLFGYCIELNATANPVCPMFYRDTDYR